MNYDFGFMILSYDMAFHPDGKSEIRNHKSEITFSTSYSPVSSISANV